MAEQGRTTLKGYFETGDTPTQAQFEDLIDSVPNISDLGVSDTEFGYLDGVTSAIQTQINAKQATITNSDDITEGAVNLYLTTTERNKLTNVPADTNNELSNKLTAVVDDVTPQLGGDLDVNGNNITGNPAIDGRRAIITEATTTKTLALIDSGDFIVTTSASPTTITIPTNASVAFTVGTEIDFIQKGAGELTISGDTGVTLNGVSAGSTAVTAQWGGATIKKIDTDEWIIVGKINDVA
jgi:hypothetical protein